MTNQERASIGRRGPAVWLATAALSIALVGLSACGDEAATEPTTTTSTTTTTTSTTSTTTSTTTTTTSTTLPTPEVLPPAVVVAQPPPPEPAPAPDPGDVAVEFVRAIMTGGDPSPWAESAAIVDEGRSQIWTADDPSIVSVSLMNGDCSFSHVSAICTVMGEARDELGNGASAWDIYVLFAEPRPGAAPDAYDDVVAIDRPVVVSVVGVAG